MPVAVDPITHKRLVLVKQLYNQAVVQSLSQHSIVGRIMAIIGLDLATETVLKAVVASLEPSKVPSDSFQALVQQAETLLVASNFNPVPDKGNIQFVHMVRNDAQHKAKYPNEADVSDCRTYTRDFLNKMICEVWNLSFEKITLTDLVQHTKVKDFLVAAENALATNDRQQAVHKAAAALTWALMSVKAAIVGQTPSFASAFLMEDTFGQAKPDRDTYRAFERMQETLLYIALGMNYADYMHFRQIVGSIMFAIDGTPHYSGMKENLTASDAEFVVGYATDVVVQIESRVGDLDAPFGREYWF